MQQEFANLPSLNVFNYLSLISLSFGVCSGLWMKNELQKRNPLKHLATLFCVFLSVKMALLFLAVSNKMQVS